jgi:flavodoxin
MIEDRILVVYYSRTGTTRKVAEHIAERLGADIEEIIDRKKRTGAIGWLMAGRDAGRRSLTEIEEPRMDPGEYDLLVIGSPVWNDTVSTPIRTYITEYASRFNNLALFTTQGNEETGATADMDALVGKAPIASIQLRKKQDVDSGDYAEKLEGFMEKVKNEVPDAPAAMIEAKAI